MPTSSRSWICPDCKAGKHHNCDGIAWDDDKDDFTSCGCDHAAAAPSNHNAARSSSNVSASDDRLTP